MLSYPDPGSVAQRVGRVDHHALPRLQAVFHDRLRAVALGSLHAAPDRPFTLRGKYRPALAVAEQRPDRYLHRVLQAVRDDRGFDAVAVADGLHAVERLREVEHHVDALLLDAERRNLGE